MKIYENKDWEEVELNGIQKNIPAKLNKSSLNKTIFINKKNINKSVKSINYVDIASVEENKIQKSIYLTSNLPSRAKRLIQTKDTIVSTVRPNLKCFAYIEKEHDGCVCSTGFAVLTPNLINDKFLYLLFKLEDTTNFLVKNCNGGNYPALNTSTIEKFEYIDFPLEEQSTIASILSSQESIISKTKDLIANLDKRNQFMMDELLSGRLRVKEENEQPVFYKNTDDNWQTVKINGEDVDIPKDWDSFKLKGNIDIKTGKKDANVAKKDGQYAFFTCGKKVLKTDTYDFDCEAILIAGNGDVGETKYYHGKFDAYQRTYVLSNYKYDLKFLYIYMNKLFKDSISALGSAMPYIKLGYLEDFSINQPNSLSERELLLKIITSLIQEKEKYEQILYKEEQTFTFLLEELMSGKLRVEV